MQILPKRIDLIARLPAGTIGSEIGVRRAYFSIEILKYPVKKLYLVDSWHADEGSYGEVPTTQDDQEANLAEAKSVLSGHMPGGRVEIIRGFSTDVARTNKTIPPLDFCYIDASHDYKSVYEDLLLWGQRMKPNGLLMGHDFKDDGDAAKWGWGVKKAVHDFCDNMGWQLIAVTDEDFASFCLQRINVGP